VPSAGLGVTVKCPLHVPGVWKPLDEVFVLPFVLFTVLPTTMVDAEPDALNCAGRVLMVNVLDMVSFDVLVDDAAVVGCVSGCNGGVCSRNDVLLKLPDARRLE